MPGNDCLQLLTNAALTGDSDRSAAFDPLSHFRSNCAAGGWPRDWTRDNRRKSGRTIFIASCTTNSADDKAIRILDACMEDKSFFCLEAAPEDPSPSRKQDTSVIGFRFAGILRTLRWAVEENGGWQFRYLLAMLSDYLGDDSSAIGLLLGDDSGFAPYYSYRFTLTHDLEDARKAAALDPDEWRYVFYLAGELRNRGEYPEAEAVIAPFYASTRTSPRCGCLWSAVMA